MQDRIAIDIHDGVADVRLIRADKMNALDPRMFQALADAGEALSNNTAVRAVVLSGEGKAFCAGLDMANFAAMADTGNAGVTGDSSKGERKPLAERSHGIANLAQHAAWVWRELPVPVIAAVHGVAFGGGFQVCLGADIRYAAPGTRMSIMEIKWGLVPDMAGTQLMRHLARDDVIRELTYTGRIVSGTEAVELGLATRVSDTPYQAALEIAAEIAGRSPDAVRAAKELLTAAPLVSIEEGLALEEKLQRSLIGRPNQVEAVQANLQKRDPKFSDPE